MDSHALARRLEGDSYGPSRHYRNILLKEPFLDSPPDSPKAHQNQVLERCRWFAQQGLGKLGLPSSDGGDPYSFHCLGYELGLLDLNLMMRFGLQFGFVLRAVSRLGSERQKLWLDKISSMQKTACLAMTETAHGSDVRRLETEAVYDETEQCFLLNTPRPEAAKDYVTGGLSADLCLVFARLKVKGEDFGVHAFLLELKSDDGKIAPGVQLSECPLMGGLRGLDYARIHFSGARVPKDNLLEAQAHLEADGTYRSSVKSQSHRFNAMIGTLVVGRNLITGGAAAGAKLSLLIALKHCAQRRQFAENAKEPERTLLSYQAVQVRLMPELATLLAIDAGRTRLAQCQHEYFEDSQKDRELETFTGALKAYTSDFAVRVSHLCRQSCGGLGCLMDNRLTELRRDLELFTTMEGDNTILQLMVSRALLVDFQRGLDRSKMMNALSWVSKNVNFAAQKSPLKSHDASTEELTSQVFLSRALRFRKDRLRYSLAARVRARLQKNLSLFEALLDCQVHSLTLAEAHCEEKIFRCLRNIAESTPPGWDKRVLTHALNLFALSRLEQHSGWYLEQSYLNPRQTRAIRREKIELCSVLAQEASTICDAFEIPQELIRSPLTQDEVLL